MDATHRTAPTHALPASQPLTQDLLPEQASQLLCLGRHQSARLQVQQGRLWLTQEGRLEDWHLQRGEQTLLLGPGRYRLGALGPESCRIALQRHRGGRNDGATRT